jgi:hypothetical protein
MPPSEPLVEVSCVLEVAPPPAVGRLYFWALQVSFVDDRSATGGGHTGLQWNPRFSGSTAVNWGGYADQSRGGGVLPGSPPELPGFADDQNTRAFSWRSGRPYRLRVTRSPDHPGAWRADVTDLQAGDMTVIRDLFGGGSRLVDPVVWSEVFADCDAPSVTVRWSDLRALDESGSPVLPSAVAVSYQSKTDGGCSNTTVDRDGDAILQMTSVPRTVPQGAMLSL